MIDADCNYLQDHGKSFPCHTKEPANKKISTQRPIPFFSTRKCNKKPAIRMAKPNSSDKDYIISSLQSRAQLYITSDETICKLLY